MTPWLTPCRIPQNTVKNGGFMSLRFVSFALCALAALPAFGKELRVCADPDSMPYSRQDESGLGKRLRNPRARAGWGRARRDARLYVASAAPRLRPHELRREPLRCLDGRADR